MITDQVAQAVSSAKDFVEICKVETLRIDVMVDDGVQDHGITIRVKLCVPAILCNCRLNQTTLKEADIGCASREVWSLSDTCNSGANGIPHPQHG